MMNGIRIEYNLTDRKIEYIVLAAIGLSNAGIANILCVAETTVKKTLEELFSLLNAVDRTSMVDNAREYHILTDEIKHMVAAKYNIKLPITHEERYSFSLHNFK